jgi:predicted GNAT family acetyltransferase
LPEALPIAHRPERARFVMEDGGREVGELVYARSAGRITILHTEVAPALRGAGEAARLVDAAVRWAREQQLKVDARCSYAHAVLVRTPAYADVLAS